MRPRFNPNSCAASARGALRRMGIPARPVDVLAFMQEESYCPPWLYGKRESVLHLIQVVLRDGAASARVPIRRSAADRRYYVYDETACPAGDGTVH